MTTYDPAWIITQPVMVMVTENKDLCKVLVREADPDTMAFQQCELCFDGVDLSFNTVFVDVGDDFMSYLALMDEACRAEPGTWVRSEPYDEDAS